jgi:ribosomal-protein-alanine N-acetyltransferase
MTQLQGFIIRKAALDDIPKVMRINLKTLPENYPEYFFREIYERFSEAFFVAEVEGEIIGYIMCRMEGGVSNFGLRWVRRGHVVSVAVLPKFRRAGLGTELMNRAMDALKKDYEAKEIILEVRVTNLAAISLYEELGFDKIRTIKTYYRNGEAALLMAKKVE